MTTTWHPASQPPDNSRDVQLRFSDGENDCVGFFDWSSNIYFKYVDPSRSTEPVNPTYWAEIVDWSIERTGLSYEEPCDSLILRLNGYLAQIDFNTACVDNRWRISIKDSNSKYIHHSYAKTIREALDAAEAICSQ